MIEFLSLDYEQKKNYIEKMLLRNKSFEQTTKFIIDNSEKLSYKEFMCYMNILSDLYDSNNRIFYNSSGNPIFTNKQDLGLYIISLKLNSLGDIDYAYYKEFFDNYLNDLNNFDMNSFDLVSGSKEKGFCFDYLLYIPKKIDNNTLIIEGNNSPTNGANGEARNSKYIREVIPIAGSFQYFLDLNAPIFIPLIPNDKENIDTSSLNYHERFARQLSRNCVNPSIDSNPVINSSDDYLYRIDLQILNAIADAKSIVYNKTGIDLEEKSLLYGFSTSGNLAVRLAFLHPNEFCGVIAGGINSLIPVPLDRHDNTNLIYPIGTYDYEMITGRKFSYDDYVSLNQYYFMGSNENATDYNIVVNRKYHDVDVENSCKGLSLNLYERANIINDIYKQLGVTSSRIDIYEGCGHNPSVASSKIKDLATSWISENQKKKSSTRK